MLNDLPTAHPPLPIGRRLAGQDCHGLNRVAIQHGNVMPHDARIRFVYLPAHEAHDPCAAYHQHLVMAEVLLGRVMAAHAAGLRPIAPALDDATEARATVKPPRNLFPASTLEYQRWYHDDGTARPQPLTQEALAEQMVASGLSTRQAFDRAIHRSHALPASEQAWLMHRRALPLAQRPLNGSEFRALVGALDGVWRVPAGARYMASANRRIALRVAAALAGMLDEYVTPPFAVAALNEAFNEGLLDRLRQTIEASRQAGSVGGVLLVGPKAWFAAKAVRMRAEHQIGLALAPRAKPGLPSHGAGGTVPSATMPRTRTATG